VFELLGVAVALFISTNIDDVFVLIGFFADSKFRTSEIIAGQYLGIAILVGISVLASLLSFSIPRPYVGLLGIVVIVLGLKKLILLFTKTAGDDNTKPDAITGYRHSRIVTVFLVTLANGGDNIIIYTPTFAVHSHKELAVTVLVFAMMTAVWCLVAGAAVNHPMLRTHFRRYGRAASPVVFMVIGIVITLRADTFGLLFRLAH
jgi:cadmium resistance protein CadD (predicted permease)